MLVNYLSALLLLSSHVMGKPMNIQSQGLMDAKKELLKWEVPEKIKNEYPLFLSGYDYDDIPVLILEYGIWNTRKVAEEGGNDLRNLERRHEQLVERIKTGYFNKNAINSESGEVKNEIVIIIDYDGLDIHQINSPANLKFLMGYTMKWEECAENLVYGFIINANAVADELITVSKPFWSNLLEKFEIYGTNPQKFIPQLVKKIPPDQLPPAYGGQKDFKSVQFYG